MRHITGIPWRDFDLASSEYDQLYADIRNFLSMEADVFPALWAKVKKRLSTRNL
jgi:hypothetical protein